ncbi:enoyl-CoA hydratase-related protein [Mesorhizobium yinganensis]|uniref:enoyl-CoA hydratase-related protein n=1 Tax=Mesorhizobium yinganensis TaxID=3157707 RepID=UPI0032B854C4
MSREGSTAVVQLNQPGRRNAISQAMWRALPELVARIEGDPGCRAVVVRGAGDAFSAGADISEFSTIYADRESCDAYNTLIKVGLKALRDIDRPTIALIDGICVGGGCATALACDLRFAATHSRFAVTPAKLGLSYSIDDTRRLMEKVGPARAKDILFSGRLIDAQEAYAIGLVDRLVAVDDIEAATFAYAEHLATLSQASIRTSKATVNAILDGADFAPVEAKIRACFEGDDFREGYNAFMEKRPPRF